MANWGRHETAGVRADGKPWSKIKRWFGYGLHLIADTRYDNRLAGHLQSVHSPDQGRLLSDNYGVRFELALYCPENHMEISHAGQLD